MKKINFESRLSKLLMGGAALFFVPLALALYATMVSPIAVPGSLFIRLISWHLTILLIALASVKLMENLVFRNWFRCSFIRIALSRLVIYLALVLALATATVSFYEFEERGSSSPMVFWSLVSFYAIIYFIATVTIESSKLVGKNFVEKLILGNYHQPRQEDRIFLFIDLNESTKLSEQLSLANYSNLIKEFFRDVEMSMEQFNGEVYQYAGDQVIISWMAQQENYDQAAGAFVHFFNKMKEKREYYQSQYGSAPVFKAALHSGTVLGTWVGRMKRELVFQGEVLNITSRLTSLAKKLSLPLLLSQSIVKNLSAGVRQTVKRGGDYAISGIAEPVEVFFLRPKEHQAPAPYVHDVYIDRRTIALN